MSSRGGSEAEPPDLSLNFSRPGWGGGKHREVEGYMLGSRKNIRTLTALRPSGAREKGFSSGGSASLHPRLLACTPPGYFDLVAVSLRQVILLNL